MNAQTGEDRPRAYYPDATDSAPARAATPGWDTGTERRLDDGRSLARGLAWFSVGLGLFQLAAPGRLTGFLGVEDDHDDLVRLYGLREIAHGVAILSERTPAAGVWSRVGGDALDLATLGVTLGRGEPRRDRVLMAMAMVAGVAALDLLSARQLARTSRSRRPAATRSRRGR